MMAATQGQDTQQDAQAIVYEQMQQLLEAELRRAQAMEELRVLVKRMRAWLNDDGDGDGKEAR